MEGVNVSDLQILWKTSGKFISKMYQRAIHSRDGVG